MTDETLYNALKECVRKGEFDNCLLIDMMFYIDRLIYDKEHARRETAKDFLKDITDLIMRSYMD